MENTLLERDLNHIWHPCTQMKDFETHPPLIIKRAEGSYLELNDGRKIIDAISSWWCKSLGHGHPALKAALRHQLDCFEHVIFANTTSEQAVELSEKLSRLTPHLNKVFYACDGASAVEIALKMSLHARQIQGQTHKKHFMALENSYHGETALALSVSDSGVFRRPYESVLSPAFFLKNIPYVSGRNDPLWANCETVWPAIEAQLAPHQHHLTALILEPIVQGSAGMKVYSPDFLRRLRAWTQQNDIHLIADEIMTGLGRTGLPLACDHASIEPDFLCLGKGLTAGFLPLSACLTKESIYGLFYDDYSTGKAFLHSHTHSGNALCLSVALATLNTLEAEKIYTSLPHLEQQLLGHMHELEKKTHCLENIRGLGALVAADLMNPQNTPRLGYRLLQEAEKRGALLRPIGNTLYWLPPFNISQETLQELHDITHQALMALYAQP